MADDTDDAPHGREGSQALSQPTPSSPSAGTKEEPRAIFPRSTSPVHQTLSKIPPVANFAPSKSPLLQPHSTGSAIKAAALDSQPMTKTSSSSSLPSVQGTNAPDTNGPSPYGTRSRNRTGNARPNYAEDRELDMEYDWNSAKKLQALGPPTAISLPQTGDTGRSAGVSTRRSSNTLSGAGEGKVGPLTSAKEPIPGTLSFALNADNNPVPPPPASKKRKAPGAITSSSTALPSVGPTTTNGHSRKAAVAGSSASHRQTNMLSFENSQGYLKNGRLKADDGTTLSINGMLIRAT